jgi:hypothetical protein
MWNDFYRWMSRNDEKISWFVIGWLCMGALQALTIGDYLWAAIDAALAYANYKLTTIRY